MAIKHVKVATVPDDGISEVGTDEWNDNHTIEDNTITDDMVITHTTTKITVPTTQLSGTVTNTQLAGSIDNTKLATDPLARANHTGTQAQSTITDLTTDLSSKADLASPTFTGTITLPNVPAIVTTQLNLKAPVADPTFTGTVVLPNVPAIVTTQLNLKAPIASPTFTGDVTLPTAGKLILNPNATYPNQIFSRDTNTFQYYVSMVAGGATLMELNGSNHYIWIKPDARLTFGGDQGKSTECSIQYRTATDQMEFRSPDDTPRMNLTTTGVDILGTLTVGGTVVGGGTPIWEMMVYG